MNQKVEINRNKCLILLIKKKQLDNEKFQDIEFSPGLQLWVQANSLRQASEEKCSLYNLHNIVFLLYKFLFFFQEPSEDSYKDLGKFIVCFFLFLFLNS